VEHLKRLRDRGNGGLLRGFLCRRRGIACADFTRIKRKTDWIAVSPSSIVRSGTDSVS